MPGTTDAIFLTLGAVLVVGMAELISSERLYPSPKKLGPRKKLTIQIVFLIAVCLLAAINLALIHTSGRASATGVIVGLSQHLGKHNHSAFNVLRQDGSSLHVNCDYDYDHLITGEAVSVEVLNYQSTLLMLSVLDGPYRGWNLKEGDGTSGSEIAIGYGFLAAFVLFLKRRRLAKQLRKQPESKNGILT
jgi:hypothetical protein